VGCGGGSAEQKSAMRLMAPAPWVALPFGVSPIEAIEIRRFFHRGLPEFGRRGERFFPIGTHKNGIQL